MRVAASCRDFNADNFDHRFQLGIDDFVDEMRDFDGVVARGGAGARYDLSSSRTSGAQAEARLGDPTRSLG